MQKKAAFHNLGCRVNAYETEAMAEQLRRAGYEIVPFASGADVYVINTCTVTNIADRKSRQMLHRAKEMNPEAVVVACGCYAEDAGEAIRKDPQVDLVVGNQSKSRLAELLGAYLEGRDGNVSPAVAGASSYDPLSIDTAEGRARAFLKIQDGCNQFCTYCMIPYVRGRVRSRAEEDVVSEAERLAENGYREVVLTGIHISSYGMDLDTPGENRQTPFASEAETNERLLRLIRAVAAVPSVRRVRLGSLEPGIMTEDFVAALADIPEICPQFHLSLQSGSEAVLRRMQRRYTAADYERIVDRLRRAFSCPAITTDVITGFPGETEEEFEETVDFVRRVNFAKMHVFKYSRRTGTKAASMPDQIPEAVKHQRSLRLIDMDRTMRHAYASAFLGRDVEFLAEDEAVRDGRLCRSGHTREALEGLFDGDMREGEIRRLTVTRVLGDGTLVLTPLIGA